MKDETKPPPKKRQRKLSEEEIALWLKVAETVVPRKDAQLPQLAVLQKAPEEHAVPDEVSRNTLNSAPLPLLKANTPPRPSSLAPIERRIWQKLSRGSLSPEASIDLHGMDQHEAYSALQHFLRNAQKKGRKLVLVVTGKGGRSGDRPDAVGILKRAVPLWLSEPSYRAIVIGFEEAARLHGGAGALYVRIRRLDRGLKTLSK